MWGLCKGINLLLIIMLVGLLTVGTSIRFDKVATRQTLWTCLLFNQEGTVGCLPCSFYLPTFFRHQPLMRFIFRQINANCHDDHDISIDSGDSHDLITSNGPLLTFSTNTHHPEVCFTIPKQQQISYHCTRLGLVSPRQPFIDEGRWRSFLVWAVQSRNSSISADTNTIVKHPPSSQARSYPFS